MKDVPDTVAAHPLVLATFTAPSFGPVHSAKSLVGPAAGAAPLALVTGGRFARLAGRCGA
jgi:hypothetical protein